MEKYRNQINEEYWVNEIAGLGGLTTLPALAGTGETAAGMTTIGASLEEAYAAKLQQLCKADEVNVYAFLFSALALTLNKYTGRNRLLLAVSGLRVRGKDFGGAPLFWGVVIDRNQPFKAFFTRNREKLLEALNHHAYDPVSVRRKLEARGFAFALEEAISFACPGDASAPAGRPGSFSLAVHASADGYGVRAGFLPGRHTLPQAEGVLTSFLHVLRQLIDAPGRLLGAYAVYEPRQLAGLLAPAGAAPAGYPEKNLAELLENAGRRFPDRPALVDGPATITFRALNDGADQLAHLLREKHQLAEGSVVAILLDQPGDIVVSMAGILKAGGVIACVPAAGPAETKAALLRETNARVLVTESRELFQVQAEGLGLVALDVELAAEGAGVSNPPPRAGAGDPAVVHCGENPAGAGVRASHGDLLRAAASLRQEAGIGPEDHLLTGFHAHPHVWMHAVLLSWCSGAALVAAGKDPGSPAATRKVVLLPAEAYGAAARTQELPGEGVRTLYLYGQTATGCIAAVCEATNPDFSGNRLTGKLLADVDLQILDEDGLPVPQGVAGELYLGSAPRAGEAPHEGVPAAGFVTHPFDAGTRWYPTGDRGRPLPDGRFAWFPAAVAAAAAGRPEPAREVPDYTPPQDAATQQLVEVCRAVLGVERLAVNHDFFALGGDSIKAIELISKLSRAGYELDMRDVFSYRIIRDIAARMQPVEQRNDYALVKGRVPLTPIQRKFFSFATGRPQHFNQAFMFRSAQPLDEQAVKRIFGCLQTHHDALRMCYRRENGRFVQLNVGAEYPLSVTTVDLKQEKQPLEALKKACDQLQTSIDLARGPLMKIGLFRLPDGDRILVILHHLVVDVVSWRIIFEDVAHLMKLYQAGEPLQLPGKTSSYKAWADRLQAYAHSDELRQERAYWAALGAGGVEPIRPDFEGGSLRVSDVQRRSAGLSAEETAQLLAQADGLYRASINEVVLTSLCLALGKCFGRNKVLLELEKHGREPLFPELDLTRTVGWFTSVYPLVIDVRPEDPAAMVREVKSQFRRVPNGGVGYGVLKYMAEPAGGERPGLDAKPQVSFNFLGEFKAGAADSTLHPAREPVGETLDPELEVPYPLDVSAFVTSGALVITIAFSDKQYRPETIERLLAAFRHELLLLARCPESTEV